jgi:hypothetical protein
MAVGRGNPRSTGEADGRGRPVDATAATTYHFHVAEAVPPALLDTVALGVRPADPVRDGAFLVADVRDQEQLHGILARFALLGLTVLEVRQLSGPNDSEVR